jgi:hypothetical protein
MLRGLSQLIPPRALPLFSWAELETLVCGDKTVDVSLMKKHTTYVTLLPVMCSSALHRRSACMHACGSCVFTCVLLCLPLGDVPVFLRAPDRSCFMPAVLTGVAG